LRPHSAEPAATATDLSDYTHASTRPIFADLVASQRLRMLRIATFMLDSTEAAEDVVHDAFVKTYRRYDSVEDPSKYLLTCVLNACRDELRKRAVLRRITPRLASPPHQPAADLYLLDALQKLPARQRAAVILRYYDDLDIAEIARALRCTPRAAESLLHHAMTALRRTL